MHLEVLLYTLLCFKTIFSAMLCVYSFKQLVGEMKLNASLVLKIRMEILYFQKFNMNEMQHQQYHIWFKGKKLENKAHKCQ